MTRRRTSPPAASFLPGAVRAALCLGTAGLLSACAGGQHISATQEAAQYEEHAHRTYNAPGSTVDPWGPYIHEASDRYDVPERWIREVMRVESGGHTERNGVPITSGAGAMGLMQVMPATYDELRGRYDLGDDPYDPHNSILAGTAYIRELYDLYGSPGFLAAYNGGPGRLDDYLTRNRALPDETRRYVGKIGPYITDSFPNRRSTAETYAMNSLPANIPAGPRYSAPAAPAPASAPVEVAYAPEAETPYEPPARKAAAPAPSYTPAPMPYVEEVAPLPVPPRPTPPVQVASLPQPPAYVAPVQTASGYGAAPAHRESGFHLVSPATAAPVPAYRGTPGQWAIQVGAFGNEGLARIAVGTAREQAGTVLSGARPAVAGVREPHGKLYRARLEGLSRDSAMQACERLSRSRTTCIVLSPDAQS